MKYIGEERRIQDHRDVLLICKQEDKINAIFDAIHRTEASVERLDMRINGTLEKMSGHVEDSVYWRRFIMGVAVSLVLSIIGGCVALFSLSYNLGQYTRQITINTDRLDEMEKEHKELRGASKE
jgi:uncharacterized membrane protein (Fun14 family)